MKTWNTDHVMALIYEAGRLSLDYWKRPTLHTEFKSDASPVTEADQAVETMFAQAFDRPKEGIYLIGEETVEQRNNIYTDDAMTADATWIVDPIDGTAPFANKLPMFGTCVGFMEKGRITHGAMIMPVFGELYITEGNQVYMTHGHDMSKPFTRDELHPLITAKPADGMVALSQIMSKRGQYLGPERVQTVCSCVYVLGNILCGRYLGAIAAGKIWDFAAGIAMFERVGGYGRQLQSAQSVSPYPKDVFVLDHSHPNRWGVRDHLVFAMNKKNADHIATAGKIPPK